MRVFITSDGEEIGLVKVYAKETYFGAMTDSIEQLNAFYLEDIRSSFVPKEWRKYPCLLLDAEAISNCEGRFPQIVCAGFMMSENIVEQSGLVIVWFQDDFFVDASSRLKQFTAEINWKSESLKGDFVS